MQILQLADVVYEVIEKNVVRDGNFVFRKNGWDWFDVLGKREDFLLYFLFHVQKSDLQFGVKLWEETMSFIEGRSCELAVNDILREGPIGVLDPEIDSNKDNLKSQIYAKSVVLFFHVKHHQVLELW